MIRYRAKVAQQRVSEIARLGDVLQDAGIKIDSVASSHRDEVGAADDRGADRRGAARAGAGGPRAWAGCGARSRTCRWRWRAGSASITRCCAACTWPPGPHRPPGHDDRGAGRPDRGDDAALRAARDLLARHAQRRLPQHLRAEQGNRHRRPRDPRHHLTGTSWPPASRITNSAPTTSTAGPTPNARPSASSPGSRHSASTSP